MIFRAPVSLKFTVPLVLLIFAGTLSTVNLLYHVPRAEQVAEENTRELFAQEISRLQSTLEYLMLKGDLAVVQHEIAVLAHNHDYILVALTDDQYAVIAATRRALLGQPVAQVLPQFDLQQASDAIEERRASVAIDSSNNTLYGYTGVLMGRQENELRPSRSGSLFLVYDLNRSKTEARAQVLQQSLYWSGWVIALALAMWLGIHFLLTRRTAQLVHAAEQLAAGDLAARSVLRGRDELGRLSRTFDTMAVEIARTHTRLREDIAKRARVQQALENSEEQYRTMFNASIDGLILWGADGRIVDVNPAVWTIYGYSQEEFSALPPCRFVGLYQQPDIQRAVAAGEPLRTEVADVRKDGSVLALEVHVIPIQYKGRPHVLTIARDVTEKKQAAEELARQREALYQREKIAALGSLLAGVAHELNNPLSVVVARAVMLEEQGGGAASPAAAQKIRVAAERCASIVRSFLAMARQQQPERGSVLINDVLLAALDITAYVVRTSNIELTLELADEIPATLADGNQFHQVLLNLIINAQQALQDQPTPRQIKLSSCFDPDANVIRITVSDNGPGIPANLQGRVFEPFFTTKPTGMGTGIGLAVSLGIVEAHGGTLTVECPASGGTVFTIVLPVVSVHSVQTDVAQLSEKCSDQLAILVVDDELDIRETLAEILETVGHRVVIAASSPEAMRRMSTEQYDVILTDIRMPDVDGCALYREIQRRWPEQSARVIFVTGDTLTPTSRELAEESGCPVIEKPFLPGEVRRIVAETAMAGAR